MTDGVRPALKRDATEPGQSTIARASATKAAGWALLSSVASRLLSTVLLIVLARLLAPQDFGLIALAAVFVALFAIFRDLGFTPALVQRETIAREHLDTAALLSIGLGCLFTAAGVVFSDSVGELFGEPRLGPVLQWLSLSFILGGLRTVPVSLLKRSLAFRALALRSVLATAMAGVVGVGVALAGGGVWALVAQALVDGLVACVLTTVASRYLPGRRFSRQAVRDLMPYGSRMLGAQLVNFLVRRTDDLLVGGFLGTVALGVYGVAYRLLRLVVETTTDTVSQVGLPAFSRLQGDRAALERALMRALGVSATLCVSAFGLMALAAADVIAIVFGPQWDAAVPVMVALAVGGVVQPAYSLHVQALNAVGKAGLTLRIATLNAVLGVAAFAIAVSFGIVAVAVAFSIRAYLILPFVLVSVQRHLGIAPRRTVVQFVSPVVAASAAALIGWFVQTGLSNTAPMVRLGVTTLGFVFAFGLALRLISPTHVQTLVTVARQILPGQRRTLRTHR